MGSPPHTAWAGAGFTVGTGFTKTVKLWAPPTQAPKVGTMLIVAVWLAMPVVVPMKFTPAPFPLAPKPTAVLSLVQANVLPFVALKLTAIVSPAHLTTLGSGFNTGTALTVAVKVMGVPVQPLSVGVTVMVPVWVVWLGDVLIEILPEPEAEIPVAVLLFVQAYIDEGEVPSKDTLMGSPPQTTWLGTGVTLGTGLTVMLKLCGAPTQVPKVGMMLMVAV